ncbi:MAG: DUF2029 domain-containing protein [Chloroflexi bacterium]|nr:DUF2029 domain-containing protein [Chloroflexota bacterium]
MTHTLTRLRSISSLRLARIQSATFAALRRTEAREARDIQVPGFLVLMGVLVGFRLLNVYPWNEYVFDLHAYWITREGVSYANEHAGPAGAYLYSPAFAQAISPLTSLPLPLFAGLWTALIAGLLLWLTGRNVFVVAMLPPVLLSIVQGQLDLVYAAVAVVGLRWPAAWAIPLLTKVTPGIGIVWFLVRREWRSLAIAVGATLAVVAVSFALDPGAWVSWLSFVYRAEFPRDPTLVYVDVPLHVRAPLALAVIVWGARTNRPWTIPVAMTLAMPILWFNSPTILVALLAPLASRRSWRTLSRREAALA